MALPDRSLWVARRAAVLDRDFFAIGNLLRIVLKRIYAPIPPFSSPKNTPHPKGPPDRYEFQRVPKGDPIMKTIILAAIGVSALALSGCASRYDGGYYDRYGYYHGYRGDYA